MHDTRKRKKNTRTGAVERGGLTIFLKIPHLLFRLASQCNDLVKLESLSDATRIRTRNKRA